MASRIIAGLRAGQFRFRSWRRGRPFWGGLLLVIAGIEILVIPTAQQLILPIDMVIYAGIAGVSGYLIGGLLVVVGVLAWLQPQQHTFFGIVATLLALASFITSNFGGFVIGMLLGLVGGAMVFAWSADKPARTAPARSRRMPWRRYLGRRRADGKDTADEEPATTDVTADTEAAEAVTETPPDSSGERSGYHAMVAVPLAVLLLAAPADRDSWWDWLLPGDSGDSEDSSEEDDPESPPESPEPSPSGGPGGEEPPEGGITPEDDEDEDDEESEDDEDEDDDEVDPAECTLALGGEALAEDEEELAAAIEACQAAEEEGELPEVPEGTSDGCFTPTVSPTGMEADRLTMYGARFEGVVECATSEDSERYLRLSMDEADFTGADLWFESRGARSTMALPDMQMQGDVVLHVTRMHVRLLGIPLTFTPDFPPPLLLPIMSVTELEVDQPLAEAAQLSIGDLEQDFRDQS